MDHHRIPSAKTLECESIAWILMSSFKIAKRIGQIWLVGCWTSIMSRVCSFSVSEEMWRDDLTLQWNLSRQVMWWQSDEGAKYGSKLRRNEFVFWQRTLIWVCSRCCLFLTLNFKQIQPPCNIYLYWLATYNTFSIWELRIFDFDMFSPFSRSQRSRSTKAAKWPSEPSGCLVISNRPCGIARSYSSPLAPPRMAYCQPFSCMPSIVADKSHCGKRMRERERVRMFLHGLTLETAYRSS